METIMTKTIVPLKLLDHAKDLPLPQYATTGSAGIDLMAAIDTDIILEPFKRQVVPTGICMSLPNGFEAQIRSRSGLSFKNGVFVLNSPGTIDSDYRGEIQIILMNNGDEPFTVTRGMRIAQLVIAKFETIEFNVTDELDETIRNTSGFGSTGIKALA
jgi:dUTP pyrophosphatase